MHKHSALQIKRGDSLMLGLAVTSGPSGPALDLTGWTIQAGVRNATGWFSPLQVTIEDPENGLIMLSADTSSWPEGNAEFDIRYVTDAGQICTTETGYLKISTSISEEANQ